MVDIALASPRDELARVPKVPGLPMCHICRTPDPFLGRDLSAAL